MPTDVGTDPADVRVEIDTVLDDPEITKILNRVERDIGREYTTPGFNDDQHRQDFEAALAALRIAEGRDRRAESVSSGRSETAYEANAVDALRKRVRRLDSGDAFGRAANIVRDDRHTTTTS
jgi:hypothetical protein